MRLFHFSDDPRIAIFRPRALQVSVDRGPDREWLNGPLVWATDERHSLLYLFPRECPRIVVWPTPSTSTEDRRKWFDDGSCWVSRRPGVPLGVEPLANLPNLMSRQHIELRALPRLSPLKGLWQSTLHASAIRMRNAKDWGRLGWTHSKQGRNVTL
jgi:hypothetical protein